MSANVVGTERYKNVPSKKNCHSQNSTKEIQLVSIALATALNTFYAQCCFIKQRLFLHDIQCAAVISKMSKITIRARP